MEGWFVTDGWPSHPVWAGFDLFFVGVEMFMAGVCWQRERWVMAVVSVLVACACAAALAWASRPRRLGEIVKVEEVPHE